MTDQTPEEMSEEQRQAMLEEIQRSILSMRMGKYTKARLYRKFHRHYSPAAIARKKKLRKTRRASRQYNFHRAKRRGYSGY